MSTSEAWVVGQVINTARYPLSEPTSVDWKDVVSRAQRELQNLGCSVLPNFVRPFLCDKLRMECTTIAPLAYYDVETVNVYNIATDSSLPEDHPGRVVMQRGNAFVARDRIDEYSIIHQLYSQGNVMIAVCAES